MNAQGRFSFAGLHAFASLVENSGKAAKPFDPFSDSRC
jgi:hypothetical protein